ncbi:LysR family transcriptional regulator, partial [Salmonella enterica]
MNIELRHLRYFVAVAEKVHFCCAAPRPHILQPPPRQRVKNLVQQGGAR